jgi:hypothetical protein
MPAEASPLPSWLKVDPTPLCGLVEDPAIQKQIAAKKYDFGWLQHEPEFRANLQSTGLPIVGTAIDHTQKCVLVVLEPDYGDWQALGGKFKMAAPGFDVLVRKACHGKAEREAAEARLRARDWHPKAQSTPVSWSPNASFAGFVVTVDEAAPEVAKALEQALGAMVQVVLGKPARLGANAATKAP